VYFRVISAEKYTGKRGRERERDQVTNTVVAAATAASVPPYRYHLPAAVFVMITLPRELGIDSTNEATIQPTAGMSAPMKERVPQPASTHVAKIATSRTIATSGTGLWLYWKLPIRPCSNPSRSSTRYRTTVIPRCRLSGMPCWVPMMQQATEFRNASGTRLVFANRRTRLVFANRKTQHAKKSRSYGSPGPRGPARRV
jgi:hypothetical protein